MKINNVSFVNNMVGFENVVSPLLPYSSGRTEASEYIKMLLDNLKYYNKSISTNISMEIVDGMVDVKVEMKRVQI